MIHPRSFIGAVAVALFVMFVAVQSVTVAQLAAPAQGRPNAETRPNVIIIFCDDLGYGDLGCFGHPTIRTPHLDRMATQGQRWTQFYVADNVCTPSRAALLTGRYPIRSGMASDSKRVLFPNSGGGLPAAEITIAEIAKDAGYLTHAVGKWHLGHLPQFLPTEHGFDTYFGIPYSNDMDRTAAAPGNALRHEKPDPAWWNVPLIRGKEVIERPADQRTITRRYTDEAIKHIKDAGDKPFFIYLAHNLPHVPLFVPDDMRGRSQRGFYGDVIEEIDHEVGRILDVLRERKLDEKTLVIFTSDNGPWLPFGIYGGSAGLLHEGKGTTWEGGHRVPTIFWWPGKLKTGVVTAMGSTLDLLPTVTTLVGGKLPAERTLDGVDLSPVLKEGGPGARDTMFYYRGTRVFAVRHGAYKAHFTIQGSYGSEPRALTTLPKPRLYNLDLDPGEKYDIANNHPQVIEKLAELVEAHRKTIEPAVDQLAIPLPK